jgi:hypothetical protein
MVSSLRLLAMAVARMPLDSVPGWSREFFGSLQSCLPNWLFFWWDLALLLALTIAFGFMWWTHSDGSTKERKYHEQMYEDQPQIKNET